MLNWIIVKTRENVNFEPEIFLISGLKRAKCRFQAQNAFQNGLEIDTFVVIY